MNLALIEIERVLRRQHHIRPGNDNDFQIRNPSDILATFEQTTAFRGLAVSPDNATLYALAADGNSVAVLDARTGRPATTLGLASSADSIAVQKP